MYIPSVKSIIPSRLEYASYNGNYYGTLKNFVFDNVNNGNNVLAILEVQGAMKVKEVFPEVILIFIMPPKFEDLEIRLRKRNTDSDEDIIKRLNTARREIEYKDRYDYVVINDDIDKCISEIKDIIKNYFEYIDECFFNSSYRKKY